MAAYNKYLPGVDGLVKTDNVATDSWKLALANTVTNTDTTFTPGTTDLATGNGYTAGGNACAVTSSTTTAGVLKLVLASPTLWTAAGGNIGPFRYAILWNATTNFPVGYWDIGSSITLLGANSDTFTPTLDAANGVFTVT